MISFSLYGERTFVKSCPFFVEYDRAGKDLLPSYAVLKGSLLELYNSFPSTSDSYPSVLQYLK